MVSQLKSLAHFSSTAEKYVGVISIKPRKQPPHCTVHTSSDKGLKGIFVNHALPSLHEGS